jgi:glycogen(starch) synthase
VTIKDIERLSAMTADRIVTVSYAMRDELVKFGYPEARIRVIHNGVDAEKYDPSRFTAQQVQEFREKIGVGSSPMILFIGRLTWVKGADPLILAMPQVRNVFLHFKMVPEEERLLYYAASDVCVFPSKYEPFGIVCTEAMSMGKPVVVGARGTSGFREQIIATGEEICGYHVNPHDPSDIAQYLVKILKSPDLAEKMGKNGRQRVLDHFTWDIISDRTIKIYQEVVDEHVQGA